MNKTVRGIIASALVCLFIPGCAEEIPEEKQPVRINVGVNTTLSMTAYADPEIKSGYDFIVRAAEDFMNSYTDSEVIVKVSEIDSSDEDKKIAGTFDTPGALDVLMNEFTNMSTYIHTGRVVPLDDIITDEIRADIDDVYWKQGCFDGKTYMMPFLYMQNVLAYNKDLFRQAGLEDYITDGTVAGWTLTEWDYVLDTLAEKLPENVYPMMMYAADEQGDTHIMTLLRSRGCPFFDAKGRLCIDCKEGIDALEWLKNGADKGYFPPNSYSMTILDNLQLFLNGQLAIDLMNSNLESFSEEMGIDFGCVNFPSPDGKGYNTAFMSGFEVFDNGDTDKLAVSKAFVKYIYESRWLEYSAGSMPVSNRVNEKYAEQLSEYKLYLENEGTTINVMENVPNWRGVRAVFFTKIYDLLYGSADAGETARAIELSCGAAIEDGLEESTLHE